MKVIGHILAWTIPIVVLIITANYCGKDLQSVNLVLSGLTWCIVCRNLFLEKGGE